MEEVFHNKFSSQLKKKKIKGVNKQLPVEVSLSINGTFEVSLRRCQ